MTKRTKTVVALATAGVTALGLGLAAAPASADNGISGEITAGALTSTLSDAGFGSVPYAFAASTQTASTTLSVSDLRGSDAGWKITVSASNLTANGGADSIPNTGMSFSSVGNPVLVAGETIDNTGGPLRPAASTSTLDSAREIVQAKAGFGEGSYTQALTLSVQVPALQDAGSYTGTFTVNQAAPDA